VAGEGRSADYVEVLRGVRFVHRRPEDVNSRTFRLTCIELRDHYASNQLAVQVPVSDHHEDGMAEFVTKIHLYTCIA